MKLREIALTPPIMAISVALVSGSLFGAAPKDFYVSTNGLHEVDGVVWGTYVTDDGVAHNAYTNLQQAIDKATSVDTVWIEDGFVCSEGVAGDNARIDLQYGKGTITVRSRSGDWRTGAEIRGQYNSEETPCGEDSVRCLYCNAPGAKFIGIRFTGGSAADSGGGVACGMYGSTYENCLVENCVAQSSGGGFYKDESRNYTDSLAARMINCVVRNNKALEGFGGGARGVHMLSCEVYGNACYGSGWENGSGGGLSHYATGSKSYIIIVSNCVFYGNLASNPTQVNSSSKCAGGGGGLMLSGYKGKVYNCVFSNNTATAWGGGLYVSSGVTTYNSLVVDNTAAGQSGGGIHGGVHTGALVARNTAKSAGGVYASSSAGAHARLINCTVADNTITGTSAPYEAGYVALTNSVVWSNKAGTIAVASNVKDSSHSCWPTATEGTADCNTAQNPKLWTRDGTTYKAYAATSVSCRGQGEEFDWMTDPADICSKDWYGDPRILGDGPDMGWVSLEAKTGVICQSTTFGPTAATVGSLFSLTTTVDNVRSGAIYDYRWTLTDLEGVERHFVSDEPVLDLAIVDPGEYELFLFVSNRADAADNDFGVPSSRLLALPLTNYVTSVAGAKPVRPYARPETAATSIHDAMELTVPGSTVILDAGTHKLASTISLSTNVTVRGAGREATVLKASATGCRLVSLKCADALVRDLTLTGGSYGEEAGCVQIVRGRLVNCAVVGNKMYATHRKGLVHCSSSEALVDRCIIASNEVASTEYNWGQVEGVVYVTAGTIRNTIICDNLIRDVNTQGSGIGHVVYLKDKNARMENCTIVSNEDRCQDGCAVCMSGSYQNTPHMYNTILSGNTAPNATIPEGSPLPNLRATGASYNYDVQKCFFVGSAAFDANSFVGTDAKFVDAAAGDYRLQRDSPCRSKGVNRDWMADALDVYGKPRLIGRKVDIGAAETESGLTLLVR